jgi:hypothetical protein
MSKRPLAIAAILLLFIATRTSAQVKLGIDAGPDFSRLLNILQGVNGSGSTVAQNSQSFTRFNGGLFVDIALDKKDQFILRPALHYVGAGGQTAPQIDFNGNQIAGGTKYAFDYLQLPVQLLYAPSLPIGKPWIGGGLYSGLLLSAKAKSNQGSSSLQIGSADNDAVKRMDYGFSVTAGFTLKCGVLIGADFQQSFGGIVPNTSSGSKAVKNSIWALHLGYSFSLK